jgi:hypothetical protein
VRSINGKGIGVVRSQRPACCSDGNSDCCFPYCCWEFTLPQRRKTSNRLGVASNTAGAALHRSRSWPRRGTPGGVVMPPSSQIGSSFLSQQVTPAWRRGQIESPIRSGHPGDKSPGGGATLMPDPWRHRADSSDESSRRIRTPATPSRIRLPECVVQACYNYRLIIPSVIRCSTADNENGAV